VATWPHAPNTSELGALVPVNVRQFDTNFGTCMGAEFRHGKRSEARFTFTQVQNGEPVTELEGEKWQEA
jgi:hypothetical protein